MTEQTIRFSELPNVNKEDIDQTKVYIPVIDETEIASEAKNKKVVVSDLLSDVYEEINDVKSQVGGLDSNTSLYAYLGANVRFGCKVTQGSSDLDMILSLVGDAEGDEEHHNPDASNPAIEDYNWPNYAVLKRGKFLAQNDKTVTVSPSPAVGLGRYDIVWLDFNSEDGSILGITTGVPSIGVKEDFDNNGLRSVPYNPLVDVEIPETAMAVARVYVEGGVTGIPDSRIADIRLFGSVATAEAAAAVAVAASSQAFIGAQDALYAASEALAAAQSVSTRLRRRLPGWPLNSMTLYATSDNFVYAYDALTGMPYSPLKTEVDGIIADLSGWETPEQTIVTGHYINALTGEEVVNSGWQYVKVEIPDDAVSIRVSTVLKGSVTSNAVWLGADGTTWLGRDLLGTNDPLPYVGEPIENRVVTPPPGAKYVCVDAYALGVLEYGIAPRVDFFMVAKNLPERVSILEGEIANLQLSYWHGKKIVWFGTSIPAGDAGNPALQYPKVIGEALGATVINEAIPSSMMRTGVGAWVKPGDPYGWSNLEGTPTVHWQRATRSMSQTSAEKEDIIANWTDYRELLTGSPPTTLNTATQNYIRNTSWEVILAKYLNDDDAPDLFVFDHGYNDNAQGNDTTVLPVDTRDRGYTFGAFNYLIDKIKAYNPKIPILMIGHYENQLRPAVSEWQMAAASYWMFPLIKLWERTGWSQQQITTNGYWSNGGDPGVWIPSGGPAQTITLLARWIPDSLHPSEDLSGDAIRHISNILIPFIEKVR